MRFLAALLMACGGFSVAARAQAAAACTPVAPSDSTPRAWSTPLDRRVAVTLPAGTLRAALTEVERVGRVRLAYSADLLPLDRPTCAASREGALGDVLASLLVSTALSPVPMGGDQIALTPWRTLAQGTAAPNATSMAKAVAVLDRVVVTGSANAMSQRDLTIALDVVDGAEMSRRQPASLADALDGGIPGLWVWQKAPTSLLSSYGSVRGASSFRLTNPKIYVDGIEAANPLILTYFAPETIERIEVIRGPQGSALYGSDAISGVINVVSAKGAGSGTARTAMQSRVGLAKSAFTATDPVEQTHVLTLARGSALESFNLTVQGGRLGAYIPNAYTQQLSVQAAGRKVGSTASLLTTARFFGEQAGIATNPLYAAIPRMPPPTNTNTNTRQSTDTIAGQPIDSTKPQSVAQYTLGSTVTLTRGERHTYTFVAGIDGYRLANVVSDVGSITSAADSALHAAEGGADRATLRATSGWEFGDKDATHSTLTFSAEHAVLREETALTITVPRNGTQPPPPPKRGEQIVRWQSNTGVTGQLSASFANGITLTQGLRLERNDAIHTRTITALPMLGGAWVRDYGPATVKLRTAYGKGIRAPQTLSRNIGSTLLSAARALEPEEQSGIEYGVDLVFGGRFSIQATQFDQRASGLVQQVPVWLGADQGGPGGGGAGGAGGPGAPGEPPHFVYQLQNIGEIDNDGYELEAKLTHHALTLSGSMSTVSSIVARTAKDYGGDLRPGDRVLGVPKRTFGLDATWRALGWSTSLHASRAKDWVDYSRLRIATDILAGQTGRGFVGAELRRYWRHYDGNTHLGASFSKQLTPAWGLLLNADNLLDKQRGEPDDATILPGRTITLGVKAIF